MISASGALNSDFTNATVDGAITLHAIWQKTDVAYSVEYYLQNVLGDEYTQDTSRTTPGTGAVDTNVTLSTYQIAIKGFAFGRYETNNTDTSSLNIRGDGQLVVRLYYTRNSYTLTIDKDNGEENIKVSGKYQSTYPLPTVTKTGYNFDEWTKESGEGSVSGNTFTFGATDATVKANWTPKIIKVTLDKGEGDSVSISTIYAKYDSLTLYSDEVGNTPLTTMPTASKVGYDFDGFYLDETLVISKTGLVSTWKYADETTLTARFTAHTYTITYQDSYGNPTMSSDEYTILDEIELATSEREGYTFGGWKVTANAGEKLDGTYAWTEGETFAPNDDGNIDTLSAGRHGDVTLVAMWQETPYTITYDTDGGDPIVALPYDILDTITLPLPEKDGFTFQGWQATLSGEGNWNEAVP